MSFILMLNITPATYYDTILQHYTHYMSCIVSLTITHATYHDITL